MAFHCESECTFPWNKNSGKKKMLLEILNKLYCRFNQVIQEKELQSKNEGLGFFSYFEKISTFFCSCSILSVQCFPYETLWECSVLALTSSSYLIQLAVSNYILKMNY